MKNLITVLTCLTIVCLSELTVAEEETANEISEDKAVIEEIRRQVEALPKDKQIAVGTEMQRAALDRIKTKSARQNVLASLGDLYAAQGQIDEALKFYRQAIDIEGISQLATYSRIKAIELLKSSGKDEEAKRLTEALSEIYTELADDKKLLDENVVAMKLDRLIQENKYNEAVEKCRQLYEQFPDNRQVLLHYAEKIPQAIRKKGDYENAIAWYEKLFNFFASAKNNEVFYSNYISALMYCSTGCDESQLARIEKAIQEFEQSFPDHRSVPVFFASFADLFRTKGLDETAQRYYQRALIHPKITADVKKAIQQMLADMNEESIARENGGLATSEAEGSSIYRKFFFAMNVCVILALTSLLLYRRILAKK